MGPTRSTEGAGGQGYRFAHTAGHALPAAGRENTCMPDPASSQTRIDLPALYKTHTFVCWLYMLDYRAYKALKCWVATCVPTCP